MIIATVIIGFCVGLGFAYLLYQDDTLSTGDQIYLSIVAVTLMVLVPTAMVVHLS